MSSSAIASSFRPVSLATSPAQRLSAGLTATLALALTAHVSFALPFTPVPFTLQPLAVLAVGLILGPLDGSLALLAYLCEGAAGLPVFSPTGPGGTLQLFGLTGGYLLADPLVALIAGFGSRWFTPRVGAYWAALVSCVLATVVLFASGAAWLNHLHPMATRTLWMASVVPFLPGEAVKILVAAGIFRSFHSRLVR